MNTTAEKPRTRATRRKPYTSYKVKAVIPKIIENHGNISKSMREVGYSVNTAKNPKNLTETKAYKVESRSVIQRMEAIRDKYLLALERKDMDKAELFTLASALKGITHDIQLLSGNSTENVVVDQQRETLRAVLVELKNE